MNFWCDCVVGSSPEKTVVEDSKQQWDNLTQSYQIQVRSCVLVKFYKSGEKNLIGQLLFDFIGCKTQEVSNAANNLIDW